MMPFLLFGPVGNHNWRHNWSPCVLPLHMWVSSLSPQTRKLLELEALNVSVNSCLFIHVKPVIVKALQ